MAAVFMRRLSRRRFRSRRLWWPGLPRRQISVWWVFRRLLSRLLWRLLPWPLRIRPLLSDRVRDDLLLLTTAQTPRANLRIASGISYRSPGLLAEILAQPRPDRPPVIRGPISARG